MIVRISELSRQCGVPTATIKYYLREGLLPSGRLTSATQAQYDDSHVSRLRLIRALLGPGRLSIAATKGVLAAVDNPPRSPDDLLGQALEASKPDVPSDRDLGPAKTLMAELGWLVDEESRDLHDLADALEAVEEAQLMLIDGGAERYARVVHELAVDEVGTVPTDSPESAVRQAVLGTILIEPLLLALRRLALQDSSRRRFDPR